MIYWLFEQNVGYKKWQVTDALEKGTLTKEKYTLVKDEVWNELNKDAELEGRMIVNDPSTNMPVLGDFYAPEPIMPMDDSPQAIIFNVPIDPTSEELDAMWRGQVYALADGTLKIKV